MTTTKEDAGKLIRMDAIGRVRTSTSQREALLDAYESSGLSGPEFAARVERPKSPFFPIAGPLSEKSGVSSMQSSLVI